MNPAAFILSAITFVAMGYGIAQADKVNAAWLLHNECKRVAIADSEIMSGGFVEIEEGSESWRCAGGVLK